MSDSTRNHLELTEKHPSAYRIWQQAREEGGSEGEILDRYREILKRLTPKRCSYSDCQAGYVILGTAPYVGARWDTDHNLVQTDRCPQALYHPGCWKAMHG